MEQRRHQLARQEVGGAGKDESPGLGSAHRAPRRGPLGRGGRERDPRGHVVFTAWPPNSLRSAAMTLAPKESLWRDRKRASRERVMTGAGTSRPIPSATFQRPSPESSTYPLSAVSSASFAKARSASSLSHDRTTLPRFQTAEIWRRSSLKSLHACRIS